MKNLNSRKKDLETMLVLAAAALVLFLVFRKNVFIFTSIGLLLLGLFFKDASARVAGLWLRFAEVLGAFNTRVILGLVYFLVLTPIAILYRLFTKRHVNSPRTAFGGSYFIVRDHTCTAQDMEKMW